MDAGRKFKKNQKQIFTVILLWLELNQWLVVANPPIIHYSHIMRILKIPYITEPGSVVYRIKASDADNDDIVFGVLEDYGQSLIHFDKIHKNEANVVLLSPLQKNEEFNLTIYANSGEESTYIESRLIATDVDENDVAAIKAINPFIIDKDPVYVFENVSLNNSIALVKALEQTADSELPVTFELMDDNDIFHFRYIFGPRGMTVAEIILLNKLDYEKQNLYILTILAINGKTNPEVDTRNVHQTHLTIVVKDVQDTAPKFENLPGTALITDAYSKDQIFFKVLAEDGDATNKRNLTFNIKKPNDEYFHIHPDGRVWSSSSYDDLQQIFDTATPIVLKIEANEIVTFPGQLVNESTSSTSQLIIVFDRKNRRPYFSEQNFIAHIDEHSPRLTSVVWRSKPLVLDHDHGFNGTFGLSLIDDTGTFMISPMIGYRNLTFTLLVNDSSRLDYEKFHNLSVTMIVKDFSPEEPLENNVTGTIFIRDINDNHPEFSQRQYYGSILENAQPGTVVASLEASDKDTGNYGQVRFTDIKGPFSRNFKIDSLTGTITLVDSEGLDREVIDEIFLTIDARDNLGTGNLNSTELYIKILDVNDNAPMFLQPFYLALLRNSPEEFVHPVKIEAIDVDQINTTNSMVNYEILQGNYENMFNMDRLTGEIHVEPERSGFRKSDIPNHLSLTVRAYDLGIPQMSSQVKVFVYVLNTPTYLPTLFHTNHILDIRNGNSSLEKSLSTITGGNVTVKELRSPENQNEPITIVTVVKYRNENSIDLDSLATAYQNLLYMPSLTTNAPLKLVEKPVESDQRMDLEMTPEEFESDMKMLNEFYGQNIRRASGGFLNNFLLYLLLALLLLLLLFLICCCCYFCFYKQQKRDSETIYEAKNYWNLQKKNSIRPSQHKKSNLKQTTGSEIVAIDPNNHSDQQGERPQPLRLSSNPENNWFKNFEQRLHSGEDIEYEIKEEKKYSNSPKTMSYTCKKTIRPKLTESKHIDILNLENGASNAVEQRTLVERKKILPPLYQQSGKKNPRTDYVNDDNDDYNDSRPKFIATNLAKSNGERQNFQFENLYSETSKQQVKQLTNNNKNLLINNSQNMAKKSLFSIAYNGVYNRQNISSESNKTLTEYAE